MTQKNIYNIPPDKTCPISSILDELGYKSTKVLYIPLTDENGKRLDKVIRVVEGGELHKKLLSLGIY